jgi:hypothetical protein
MPAGQVQRLVRPSVPLGFTPTRPCYSFRSTDTAVQTLYLSSGGTLLPPENVFQHSCGITARRGIVRNEV